jgi:hypothetical protein
VEGDLGARWALEAMTQGVREGEHRLKRSVPPLGNRRGHDSNRLRHGDDARTVGR